MSILRRVEQVGFSRSPLLSDRVPSYSVLGPSPLYRGGLKRPPRTFFEGKPMDLFIVHSRPNPYTAVPNGLISDSRLTWKAKAIFAYLLSRPTGWRLHLSDIVSRARDGRDAVLAGMAELEDTGYIRRRQGRDAAGRMGTVTVELIIPEYSARPESPLPGFPDTAFPDTEKPTLSKQDITKPISSGREDPAEQIELIPPDECSLDWFVGEFPVQWNAMCGRVNAVRIFHSAGSRPVLTSARLKAAGAVWRESEAFRLHWKEAISALERLPDWTGSGKNRWRINVDYFLKPGVVEQILERSESRTGASKHTRESDAEFRI